MIKAFLFDYDGVITAGVPDNSTGVRLGRNLGISTEEASKLIVSIWNEFSTGRMSEREAWQKIERQYGKPISDRQRDAWNTWDELRPLPKMLELVRTLKSKGYPVGLLSNVLPVTAQLIHQNGGYDDFDFVVLSCEVGARKPNAKMYHTALSKFKDIKPDEVLYLDDREPLTIAASKLGIQSLHVSSHDKTIRAVLGLVNN